MKTQTRTKKDPCILMDNVGVLLGETDADAITELCVTAGETG